MYGIVTIVEGAVGARVEAVWASLRERHGADVTRGHNVPHVSFHVADDYDLATVEQLLERVAAGQRPFEAPLFGLGVLPLEEEGGNVVMLNVARSPQLSALHEALWEEASAAGVGVIDHYHPEVWFPHLTLGDHPSLGARAPEIVALLRPQAPRSLRVENLAVIEEMPYGHEVRLRVALAGR